MKRILSTLLLVLTIGCVRIPMTTIEVPTSRGVVTIKAPKDSKITGLKADFVQGTVSLDAYEARMNPDVIGASALGQVELIKAYGDLSATLAQIGLQSFAASHGVPLARQQPQAPQPATPTITAEQLNALINERAQQIAAANAAATTNQPASIPRNAPDRRRTVSTNTPPSR